jgi:hypothetical protein
MSDLKSPAAGLRMEMAVGSTSKGTADGPLDKCSFRFPYALCQFDGTLFVVDNGAASIRAVDGVLGSDCSSSKGTVTVSDFEASLAAALLTAIPALPKELARVMTQYARPIGVRTIAGAADAGGHADGHALRAARFLGPSGIAVDLSDAAAGPQLIITDHTRGLIRCLNLHSETVTTIAGRVGPPYADGPALDCGIPQPYGVAVAPNGVIFVVSMYLGAVLRISAPKRSADDSSAERFVSVAIGPLSGRKLITSTVIPAEHFRVPLKQPLALCMVHSAASAAGTAAADGKDAVRLFVGCADGVHSFDLARGEHKHFPICAIDNYVTGLAVDEVGAQLFALSNRGGLSRIDLHSDTATELIPSAGVRQLYEGPACQYALGFFIGAVYDAGSRSLIVCENAGRLLRVRGVSGDVKGAAE